jgi:hypothetical protein
MYTIHCIQITKYNQINRLFPMFTRSIKSLIVVAHSYPVKIGSIGTTPPNSTQMVLSNNIPSPLNSEQMIAAMNETAMRREDMLNMLEVQVKKVEFYYTQPMMTLDRVSTTPQEFKHNMMDLIQQNQENLLDGDGQSLLTIMEAQHKYINDVNEHTY